MFLCHVYISRRACLSQKMMYVRPTYSMWNFISQMPGNNELLAKLLKLKQTALPNWHKKNVYLEIFLSCLTTTVSPHCNIAYVMSVTWMEMFQYCDVGISQMEKGEATSFFLHRDFTLWLLESEIVA